MNRSCVISLAPVLARPDILRETQRLLDPLIQISSTQQPDGDVALRAVPNRTMTDEECIRAVKVALTAAMARLLTGGEEEELQGEVDLALQAHCSRLVLSVDPAAHSLWRVLRATGAVQPFLARWYLDSVNPVDRLVLVLDAHPNAPMQTLICQLMNELIGPGREGGACQP